jgi:hypothetical protein
LLSTPHSLHWLVEAFFALNLSGSHLLARCVWLTFCLVKQMKTWKDCTLITMLVTGLVVHSVCAVMHGEKQRCLFGVPMLASLIFEVSS